MKEFRNDFLNDDNQAETIEPKLTDYELSLIFNYCHRLARLISLNLANQDPAINFDYEIPVVLSALSLMFKNGDVESFRKNYGARFEQMLKDAQDF